MAEQPLDLVSAESVIQPIFQEINNSTESLKDIINYCHGAYPSNRGEVFQQTKQYTSDAILNAVYHIHRGADALLNFLDVQTEELKCIEENVSTITERFKILREMKETAFIAEEIVREPLSEDKSISIQPEPTPQQYKGGKQIDLNALNNVGISLD